MRKKMNRASETSVTSLSIQHKHITRLIWREKKMSERLFKHIMVKHFPNRLKNMNLNIQEVE